MGPQSTEVPQIGIPTGGLCGKFTDGCCFSGDLEVTIATGAAKRIAACVSVQKASDSRQPGSRLPGSFRKEVISEFLFY